MTRRAGGAEKGFLNRRFKRVFAYFWRAPKVGAGRPGARSPRAIEQKQLPRAGTARKKGITL